MLDHLRSWNEMFPLMEFVWEEVKNSFMLVSEW